MTISVNGVKYKNKKIAVRELSKKGLSPKEIVEKTDIKRDTVDSYRSRMGLTNKGKNKNQDQGENQENQDKDQEPETPDSAGENLEDSGKDQPDKNQEDSKPKNQEPKKNQDEKTKKTNEITDDIETNQKPTHTKCPTCNKELKPTEILPKKWKQIEDPAFEDRKENKVGDFDYYCDRHTPQQKIDSVYSKRDLNE